MTALRGGALRTISLEMPVSWVIKLGIGRPGLTSVVHSLSTRAPEKRTAPISMMVSLRESRPVVSISRATIEDMGRLYHSLSAQLIYEYIINVTSVIVRSHQ